MKKIESNITYNHLSEEVSNSSVYDKTTIALFVGEELLIIGLCALMILMF